MKSPSFKRSQPTPLILSLSLLCAACAAPPPPIQEAPTAIQHPPEAPAQKPPPYISPPQKREESWLLPPLTPERASFPYLPDEDRTASRSIGEVTTGFLVNGQPLPLPHPHLAILPRQFARHLQYTSQAMIDLLDDAAVYLAKDYPKAVVYLGNLGRIQGGDIPYSVSHTNGRDADIAFFVVDENGQPAIPPDLLPLDEDGIYDGTKVEDATHPDLFLRFDEAKNWRLVEGLLQSKAAHIQYIFVSRPLRRILLEEARRQGADAKTLRAAQKVLVQPGGALPHDDHFHLRIHCSPSDLAMGCQERGRPGPTYRPDQGPLRQTIRTATALLDDENPHWRQIGLRRLALINDHGAHRQIRALLNDPDPLVRAAATRALHNDTGATDLLANRLLDEDNPHVFIELITALSHRGTAALEPLTHALQRELLIERGPAGASSSTAITARALASLERPQSVPHLIEALTNASTQVAPQIEHALQMLTNHSLSDPSPQAWQHWWQEHRELSRDQWLVLGFQKAGFQVQTIGAPSIWELCRAITAQPYLNFNAQRSLMRLSGRTTSSLSWHPHDASFYWRRYFEEHQEQLALPPIPQELSTADGYTKPQD